MCLACGKRSASPPPMPLSMPTHTDANALVIGAQGRLTSVSLNGSSLLVQRNADSELSTRPLGSRANDSNRALYQNRCQFRFLERWPRVESDVYHVLWAELKGGLFNLSFLARRTHGAPLSLVHVSGSVGIDDVERAASLATRIMDKAYAGIYLCVSADIYPPNRAPTSRYQ